MSFSSAQREELETLIRRAGDRLLSYWPGGTSHDQSSLHVEKKKDGSLVSKADFESNEIIVQGLSKLFPQDGIFSEELARDTAQTSKERVWIVDPLDGTKTFLDGNDDFSVLMGLSQGKSIEFGMMYFPARKQFAVGERGKGATLNGLRLKVSPQKTAREKGIYLRHLELPQNPIFYDKWMDSGMAFLSVANGTLDGIILKLVHHQEWDLAAPTVMITEAGGRVSDEHGNTVVFNRGPVRTSYFVASNGLIHEDLLKLIPR